MEKLNKEPERLTFIKYLQDLYSEWIINIFDIWEAIQSYRDGEREIKIKDNWKTVHKINLDKKK